MLLVMNVIGVDRTCAQSIAAVGDKYFVETLDAVEMRDGSASAVTKKEYIQSVSSLYARPNDVRVVWNGSRKAFPKSVRLTDNGTYDIQVAPCTDGNTVPERVAIEYPEVPNDAPVPANFFRLPVRAEISNILDVKLVCILVGPAPGYDSTHIRPDRIPVLTIMTNGDRLSGLVYENDGEKPVWSLIRAQPRSVNIADNGVVTLKSDVSKYTETLVSGKHKSFEPADRVPVPGTEWIPVSYGPRRATVNRGPGWQLVFQEDMFISEPPNDALLQLPPALDRIATRFNALLSNNAGRVVCGFKWRPLPDEVLMATQTFFAGPVTYANTVSYLTTLHFLDNESVAEGGVYSNLPVTGTLQARDQSGVDRSVAAILVSNPIYQKWLQAPPNATDMEVSITNVPGIWDYDDRDDAVQRFGGRNLNMAMTHEVIHGLGFFGQTGDFRAAFPFLSIWDLFRLPYAVVGDNPSTQNFRVVPRMTETGVDAIGLTLLAPGNSFRLMNGADSQPNHWFDDPNNPAGCIGVMDPYGCGDFSARKPGYITNADKQALDIIGWNIDMGAEPIAAAAPDLVTPLNLASVNTSTPTLTWQVSAGTVSQSVFVGRDSPPNVTGVVVYRSDDLDWTASSITVPSGLLMPGVQYTWNVTAINEMGSTYSEVRSFTVGTATCRVDFDGSGAVNIDDIFIFLNAWFAGCLGQSGSPCFGRTTDFDMSGALSIDDIFIFINAWFGGCP
jgi:hypothetical protein